MSPGAPTDTLTADIAVRVESVSKVFRQKDKASTIGDAIRSMFSPRVHSIRALDSVSFEVHAGEILAYAGPNGAGKSTTIKMLAGLLTPDRGRVSALSMDPVRDRVRYMKRAGVLFGQRTELWWDHTVKTSFDWKQVVWEIPADRYKKTAETLVDLLAIGPFLNAPARELSLG